MMDKHLGSLGEGVKRRTELLCPVGLMVGTVES